MLTVMQLVIRQCSTDGICARGQKLSGLALAEGIVACDGANRRRVEDDLALQTLKQPFLVSDRDGVDARHAYRDAVGRLARAPFIGVTCYEGVQSSVNCLRRGTGRR